VRRHPGKASESLSLCGRAGVGQVHQNITDGVFVMNSGKSQKSRSKTAEGFRKKFVILSVLTSFILSNCPAYASREDRLDRAPRFDKAERQERRAERLLQRQVEPRLTQPMVNPQLAPIFQNVSQRVNQRLNALEQPRIQKALVTGRREARQNSAAQQLSSKTVQDLGTGRARNVNARLNLDLSSNKANITLGEKLLSNGSVTINVGGEQQTFSAGSKVTAAQYASILQELNGDQSLVLDSKGTASGGTLDFQTLTASGDNLKLSSLVIPEQVAAIGNFSRTSDVELKGDVVNFGSIHAISNRDGGTKATIATNNLHNASGALISSVPNASLGTDLASTVDLKLRADDTLSNQGTIESSGDLTLSAGKQLINGDVRGRGMSGATATAQNNLYIDAPVVSNSGLLAAATGDVNFTAPVTATADGSISVNSERGTVQALNGAINFRDSSAGGKPLTTITGGHWDSKELNLWGGDGTVAVDAQSISGTVSMHTGIGQVASREGDLTLGEMVTTGDPLVQAHGNVNVTANITSLGGPITLLAENDIVIDPGILISSGGGTILMVAGANFEDPNGVHPTEYWILGGTANGGNIFASSGAAVTIDSGGGASAGSIQMVAFAGSAGGGNGDIFLDNSTITAIGTAGNANGNITATGQFVSLNTINNRGVGATAGTGNVSINSFNPTIVGGQVRIDTSGAIVSGTFGIGTTPTVPGDVFVGSVLAGNNVSFRASNNLVMSGGILSNAASATALNNLFLDDQASFTSPAGVTLVASHDIYTTNITAPPSNNFIDTSAAGNAGSITIVAGANFTETATQITINSISATGGQVDLSGFALTDLLAQSTVNGNGGNITVAAFQNAGAGSGAIRIATTASQISASGGTGGTNGNITMVNGSNVDALILGSEINNVGGSLGGGTVTLQSSVPATGAVVSKTTGGVTSGTFLGGATRNGNVSTLSVTTGGSISLNTGGTIIVEDLTSGDDVTLSAGGDIFTFLVNVADDFTASSGNTASFSDITGTNATSVIITSGGETNISGVVANNLSVAAGDDIVLFGNIATPAGVSLVANRNIFTGVAGLTISTAAATGGGDIVMAAGAAFTSDAGTITISGASGGGGVIDFDGNNLALLTTRGTAGNTAGGDLTMVAFNGTVNSGGVFTDITTSITTGGFGTGANGFVTVIAGGDDGNTIGVIGPVNTTGGSGAAGNVFMSTSTPDTTPNVIVSRANATLTNDFSGGALQPANLFTGTITSGAGTITLQSGGTGSVGAMTTTTGAISVSAGSFLDVNAAVNAGSSSITLLAGTGNIAFDANLTARSGILIVSGRDIFTTVAGLTLSTSGTGDSGNISLIAGATFTQTATLVTITGASTTGGQVDFDFNNVASINTTSTGGGGDGGAVTLVGFDGTDASGRVLTDTTTTIVTGGNGAGTNGNLTVVAGNDNNFAVSIGSVNTTGGALNTGDITILASTPDTSPNVQILKSDASLIPPGNFTTTGTLNTSDVTFGALTVNNGADITVRGGNINGTTLTGGANSVLTMSTTTSSDVTFTSTNIGTVNIASLGDVFITTLNQGATGVTNISAAGFAQFGAITSGAINITGGTGGLTLNGAVSGSSVSMTSGLDITVGANISAHNGILLVSGRDIFGNAAGITFSTSGTGTSGDITMVAGAAFNQDGTSVTITGGSATGGQIDLDFNNTTSITSTSTGGGGAGGDITLAAFEGSLDTGRVLTDATTTMLSGGNGAGVNGNVTIVAGNNTDFAVNIGSVNSSGGSGGQGAISIRSSTPATTPNVVIQKVGANITAGNLNTNATIASDVGTGALTVPNNANITVQGGDLLIGAVTGGANSQLNATSLTGFFIDLASANLGTVNLTSGANLFTGAITLGTAGTLNATAQGLGQFQAISGGLTSTVNISVGGTLELASTVNVGAVSALARDDISMAGDITAPTGIVIVSGHNIYPGAFNVVDLSTASATTNAGDIVIIAGANYTDGAGIVTITGASTTGGFIDFDTDKLRTISSRSTAANGNGGDVTMIAFNGTDDTGSVLTDFEESVITTGGSGTGTNGNFTVVAGANQFDGIGIRGTLNTSGGNVNTGNVYISTSTPDTTPNVVIQKSGATYTGDFTTSGTTTASSVYVDFVTVGNGADVTINSGADVFLDSVTAGSASVLTITSALDSNILSTTNAGTIVVTAGQDAFLSGAINQGLVGGTSLTVTAARDMEIAAVTSGNVRLAATTGSVYLGGLIQTSGSTVATAGQFISLDNDILSPGGIVLVAGRSITPNTGGIVDLSTANTTGSAGDMTIIAGAAFNQVAGTITITGASATGGNIDFDFLALNSLDTRSSFLNGSGGDITMVAFAGSDAFTGSVYTNPAPSTIRTGGNGTGANGNLTAIGNATSGSAVGIRGTLDTTGGQLGTGDVWLAAATPVTSTPVIIQKNNGSISTGDFRNGALANSDVFADLVTVNNGADVTVRAGGNAILDTITAGANSVLSVVVNGSFQLNSTTAGTATISAGTTITAGDFIQGANGTLTISSVAGNTVIDQISTGNVRISTGGFLNLTNTVTASGSVSAVATNSIVFSNNITAPGGILLVSGHDISPNVTGTTLSTANAAGNAGDITVVAGAAFTQDASTVTITGASTTGGAIDFDFFGVTSINARSTAANGVGGDVTMVAFTGTDNTGFVFTDTAGSILTGGSGAGANGELVVIGGDNDGAAAGVRGTVNTTGGAAGTGNVWIAAATPDTTPNVVLSKSTASVTAGDFRDANSVTGGDIFTDAITVAAGATINVQAGGFLSLLDFAGGTNSVLRVSAGESVSIRTVNVGSASVTAGTFMTLNGNIQTPGGLLLVAGGDIFPNASALTISTSSTTGDAGDLTMVAGAAFTQTATTVTITGASATGGRIDMDANNLAGLLANSSFAGGDGGDITLVSFYGSADTGEIFTDAAMQFNAGGNGAGDNGNITLVSSRSNGADGIVLNNSLTLTGGAQGTGTITLSTSNLPGNVILSKATGAVTTGTFLGGTGAASDIDTLNITNRGGDIVIRSGNAVQIGVVNVAGNVNGAGGSVDIRTAGTNTLTLSGAGVNSVASIIASGGSTSGAGGSVTAVATGTGGITIAGLIDVNATEGNGGAVSLTATNGDIAFGGGVTVLTANAGTTSATARAGGTISLTGNNITGTTNLQLQANGVSGGAGGTIQVTTNVGDITVGTGAGQLSAQANGPGGLIELTANGGGDILVQATGNLTAPTVDLQSASGTIVNNGTINGSTAVNLQVSGANTISGSGTVAGGLLTVTAGTGSTTLTTNVTSLTLATNGNVTITETDDLTVNAGTTGAGSLSINVTGDDLTFGGAVTANGGFTLTTSGVGTIGGAGVLSSTGQLTVNAGTGAISLSTNVASFSAATTSSAITINEANNITLNNIVAQSLTLTAGNGIAHGTGVIDADSVDLSALGGDIGASGNPILINNGANAVTLTADATGDIFITIQGTGPLFLGTTTGDDVTLVSAGPITTTGDITATNVLDITTNSLDFEDDTLSADIINIQSNVGSGLTLDGGTNGGIMTATTEINITATFGNLDLFGVQDYFGTTTMTAIAAPGATVNVDTDAVITGHDELIIISNGLVQDGTISGNPLTIANEFFTIANSIGDVNLTGDIVFEGQSLAILARGNINIIGTLDLIDLSDTNGNAGNLFMVAGYDFIPATGGQIISGQQFTLSPNNHSTIGGSINLTIANIVLTSGAGNGGNLTAIATTGSTNAGTVNLGNIDVGAVGGTAGNILIVGEGGVNIGDIDALGTGGNGDVHIAVALPNITGGNVLVTDGVVTGGSFQSTTLSAGNMVIGSIAADEVTLRGASGAANTMTQTSGAQVVSNTLSVEVGAGTATITTDINTLNASGNGTINIDQTGNLQLGTLTSANNTLTLNVLSDAIITTPVGGINDVANLALEGTAGAGQTAVVLNGPISTYNSFSVVANGGADIDINNLTITSPNVSLESTGGDVIVSATGIINASTSATLIAFDTFLVAGTINTQTLALTSGDTILNGDLTGTITAPAGLFLTSTNGGVGLDANTRFVTNAAELRFSAGGGGVYINSTNTTGVLVSDVSASTEVDIITAGPTTVSDVSSGNGDISIVQNGIGTFIVAAGANIQSTEGDIILQNNDLNKKTGKIIIDDGANIKGSGTTAGVGEVFITLGNVPPPPYTDRKKPPKGVTVNEIGGGGVFLGKKGIDVRKETNIVLNALGVDLVFNLAPKMNKKNIHVGSNVTITADPPWHTVPTSVPSAKTTAGSMPQFAHAADQFAQAAQAAQTSTSALAIAPSLNSMQNAFVGETQSLTTALATDLNAKSTTELLSEKTTALTTAPQDALSAIFGDESAQSNGVLNASLVSDVVSLDTGNASTISSAHSLTEGCAIYAPSHDVTVNAGQASIAIAAGSVVLVVNGSEGTSVYDLHDAKRGAVKVSFHGQAHTLSPARHTMVCPMEKSTYADANIAELILHRGVNNQKTNRGGNVFTSEFLVNSAIDCVPALSRLMSSNHPSCTKLAAKLTKTQAVILHLSQSNEEFQQHVKPQYTAMR